MMIPLHTSMCFSVILYLTLMVAQTNLYAEQVIYQSRKPRLQDWRPVIMEEMQTFLGLTLMMGAV